MGDKVTVKPLGQMIAAKTKDEEAKAAAAKEAAEEAKEAADKAERGCVIVVTVSKGFANRELPNIAGQTVDSAVGTLNENGFIASPGSYSSSDTVEAGKVIGYENYNAGDLAPYGSKISIKVSTGPER